MNNFLIGMHGGFDVDKYRRDFREGFWGVEACLFPDETDLGVLLDRADKDGFNVGVHFPILKSQYKYRDPLFMALSKSESKEAYSCFEAGVVHARDMGAKYILTHFPKPFLVDRSFDWSDWRCEEYERIFLEECPITYFNKMLNEMFERLSEMSDKYNVKVVLEHDALSKHLYTTGILEELFDKYNRLSICLDTGRLHLFSRVDKAFDSVGFAERMSRFASVVHLWNEQAGSNAQRGHYPCLPELKPSEGWGDIEAYLKTLAGSSKELLYKFEHDSSLISDEQLESCYSWVNDIIAKA